MPQNLRELVFHSGGSIITGTSRAGSGLRRPQAAPAAAPAVVGALVLAGRHAQGGYALESADMVGVGRAGGSRRAQGGYPTSWNPSVVKSRS